MTRSATACTALVLVSLVLSACAREPATIITLDEVASERLAALDAAERAAFDDFVEQSHDRLVQFGIPEPRFGGLVSLDELDARVTECIVALNPRLQVARRDAGFTVTYFGTVGDTYDRIRWTIESCNAQYGVADLTATTVIGSVESAWRYQDATHRVVPCLRGLGVSVPTAPSALEFARHVGTAREFNPYAFAIADPVSLARAVAVCPPSDAVIDAYIAGFSGDLIASTVSPREVP